jgi:DNA repair protein RecO (recombination protein O)
MAQRDIVRTEAVVLRGLDYSESSRIVTLLTRERGKIAVLAKGARRTKSKFGATLQPMAHTQVVFYYKPTRSLQMLSESSHVSTYRTLSDDLLKITLGLRIVELTDALLSDEDPQPAIFELLVGVLHQLDAEEERPRVLWPFFQLRLAEALGVAPAIQRDRVEAIDEVGWLSLADGGVYPIDARPSAARKAARTALRAYAVIARARLNVVLRMHMEPGVHRTVQELVDAYLRHHFDESIPDRCRTVLAQLRDVAAS